MGPTKQESIERRKQKIEYLNNSASEIVRHQLEQGHKKLSDESLIQMAGITATYLFDNGELPNGYDADRVVSVDTTEEHLIVPQLLADIYAVQTELREQMSKKKGSREIVDEGFGAVKLIKFANQFEHRLKAIIGQRAELEVQTS